VSQTNEIKQLRFDKHKMNALLRITSFRW